MAVLTTPLAGNGRRAVPSALGLCLMLLGGRMLLAAPAAEIEAGPWRASATEDGAFSIAFSGQPLIVASSGYIEYSGGLGTGTVEAVRAGTAPRLVFTSGPEERRWRREVVLSETQCLILFRIHTEVDQPRGGEVHLFLSADTLEQARYTLRSHRSADVSTYTLDRHSTTAPPEYTGVRQGVLHLPMGKVAIEPASDVESGGPWYLQPAHRGNGNYRLVAVPRVTPERPDLALAVRLRVLKPNDSWLPNATEVELANLALDGYALTTYQDRRYVRQPTAIPYFQVESRAAPSPPRDRGFSLQGLATILLEGVAAVDAPPVTVRYRWLDPYDREVKNGEFAWTPIAGQSTFHSVSFQPKGGREAGQSTFQPEIFRPEWNGVYRLEIEWDRPNGELGRSEALLAKLPLRFRSRRKDGLSYFGGIAGQGGPFTPRDYFYHLARDSAIHIPFPDFWAAEHSQDYFYHLARDAGTGWLRTHDATAAVTWPFVQPQPDVWVWDDSFADSAQSHGLDVMATLGGWPEWLNVKGEEDYLREDVLAAWGQYVENTVRHFGDRIKYWEIINEPYWLFAQQYQRPDIYARYLEIAHERAKRVDPACVVVGTCGPPRDFLWQWYDQTFSLGTLEHQDMVSVHFYPSGFYNLPADFDLAMDRWYAELQGIFDRHGRRLPLVSTEGNNGTVQTFYRLPQQTRNSAYGNMGKPQSPPRAAQTLVRTYLVNMKWGAGYSWHCMYLSSGLLDGHVTEYDGTPMPLLVAHAALSQQLGDGEFTARVELHPRVQCLVWRSGDDVVATIFPFGLLADEAGTLALGPAGWRYYDIVDLYGNPTPGTPDATAPQSLPLRPDELWYVRVPKGSPEAVVDWLRAARVENLAGKPPESKPDPHAQGLEEVPIGQTIQDLFIDLRPFCNVGFADETASDGQGGWTDQGPNDLRQLPPGVWASGPAHFLILDPAANEGRSCLVFRGGPLTATPDHYPTEVTGIPVHARLRSLDLFHGAAWISVQAGESVLMATYTVHYESGARETFEVQAGPHLLDWWTNHEGPLPGGGEVAWHGANLMHEPILLYRLRWTNPRLDDPVTSLDIRSSGTGIYGLISLTGTKGVP